MRKIDSIILHCSAVGPDQTSSAEQIDRWHRQKGWKCIGYHYVIRRDGTIEKGRDISQAGAHCKGHNAHSIGICYEGGLDAYGKAKDTRTEAQKKAMNNLVSVLMTKYHLTLANVHCHNEYANKDCPCFKIEDFRKSLSLSIS